MLQSIKDLRGYAISATDGEIGTVEDFYFDDFRWRIRYVVVATGAWLIGKRVLISPIFAGPADANARSVPVSLTQEQVKGSPDIDTDKPVSRQRDSEVTPCLELPLYGFVAEPMFPPTALARPKASGGKADPHLRSTNEVRGYRVSATNGEVGRVEDFIFDETSWDIRFIIVDTRSWLNLELVLIAPQWITEINWEDRTVRVDLDVEKIRNSPKFYPIFPIPAEYALQLQNHYDRKAPETDAPKILLPRAETKALYDKISKVYDVLAESSEAPVRRRALDRISAQPGETILEIGFGTGHCLVDLAKAVGPLGRVHGIDLSDGMLGQARSLIAKTGVGDRVELRRGDAIALPYQDGVMDGVFMSFTLEVFDSPEIPMVLRECRRVLKPGGRIVVAGMSKEGGHGLIFEAYQWTHRHFPNFVDCRPIRVRKAIEEANFAVRTNEIMRIWVPVEIVLAIKSS